MEAYVTFHQLPVVVVTNIMTYVPLQDKLNVMNVSPDWARLIRSINPLWKCISIDKSSTFGGDWKDINTKTLVMGVPMSMISFDTDIYPCENTRKLNELLLQLTEATDSIEHFHIDVCGYVLQERALVKLLTKQKRLRSLSLCFSWKYSEDSNGCHPEKSSTELFEIIKIHQNTLEYLNLSNIGISFQHWHKYLKGANFPSLKKISYPMEFSDQQIRSFNANDKETVRQCFMQTLENGKIEEINMNTLDYEAFLMGWVPAIANPLKDQLLQGKARHLKKIHLDSLFVNERCTGSNLENIADDIDTFMKQCPELTHLKSHFSRGTIPSEQLGKLIRHYSSQIVHLQCEVTDTIAEVISNNCMNLTALAVSGHNKLSDKALLAFCKLSKLENLHLRIKNKDSITGLTTLLNSCMCNLKELSLELPWNFYNEAKTYSSIVRVCSNLKSLSLSNSGEAQNNLGPGYYRDGIKQNTFIEGLLKVIASCPPLKSLKLQMVYVFEDFRWEKETTGNVFHCIIKYQPMLTTLTFDIEGMLPADPFLMNYVVHCMPYCQIKSFEL